MLNSGLHRLIDNLIDSINLTYEIYQPIKKSSSDEKWINTVVSESWSVINKADKISALEFLIKVIVDQNINNLHVLFKILSIFIEEDIYTCKDIACALVNSESLKVENKHYFRLCYSYINILLPSLDYKANREVFNKSIEKSHSFPVDITTEERRSLHFCLKVIRKLLSRKNNLMPAYFAMHELMKCFYPDDVEKQPHKLLVSEIFSFMNSFRKPAKLLIPFCRHFFYPIVGLTHPGNSSFRLDGNNLTYPNVSKGAILYAENISRPQLDECTKLLIQTRSIDLVVLLYDLPKTLNSKYGGLENAFAQLIFNVMLQIEACDNPDNHRAWIMGMIEHLVCSVLNFLHTMSIGFCEIFSKLNAKTANRTWFKSRKYIWWFVINATSGFINKNMLEDFVPCLKFFDILYPSNDKTWSEDIREALKSFGDFGNGSGSLNRGNLDCELTGEYSSHNFSYFLDTSPLVLWMHLIRKSKSIPTILPRHLPPPLQPIGEIVTHEISRLEGVHCFSVLSGMRWHELIMVLNTYSTKNETASLIGRINEFLWGIKSHQSTVAGGGGPSSTSSSTSSSAAAMMMDQSNFTEIPTFSLPYGLRGQGKPVLIPNEIIGSMSVHVRFLFNHLLMISLFTEPQNINCISPHIVESFCRLILHREMDIQNLNKFIEKHFIHRAMGLLPTSQSNDQSASANKNVEKRLFYTMLDILINRCSYYLSPEITVNLWFSMTATHNIYSDLPLQIQFQIDASLLQLSRFFQKPDLVLYGLSVHTLPPKNIRQQQYQQRLLGESEEVNKHDIITLIQLYKAYEMEEVLSWKTFITEKVKLLQQRQSNASVQPGQILSPIRFNQLQIKEIPESLLLNLNGLIMCENPNISESIGGSGGNGGESICVNTSFGPFNLSLLNKQEFDNIIVQIEKQISPNINYQNLRIDYWQKLAGTSYLYGVVLRLILELRSVKNQVIAFTDHLNRRNSDQMLRFLCDYVVANVALYSIKCYDVNVFSTDQIIEALEMFIFQFNIIPFDRFLMFLINRNYQNGTWRVVFYLINEMFSKFSTLIHTINYLYEQCPNTVGNPCHLDNWHQIHFGLHDKLPEVMINSCNANQLILPQYYNHLLLRLIPVVEMIISSLMHVPHGASVMTNFFTIISKLFKFHSYPLYFCYTLIRSQLAWSPENRRLMQVIVHHILQEHQSLNRYFSNTGWKLLTNPESHLDHDRVTEDICRELLGKIYMVFVTFGKMGIPYKNWRYDQSSSAQAHAVYAAVIELMLSGSSPQVVIDSMVSICLEQKGGPKFPEYVNIFGCVVALFSKEYRQYATHKLTRILIDPVVKTQAFIQIFFTDFLQDDWDSSKPPSHGDSKLADLQIQLCLWHSMWIHANVTQITNCVNYIREFIKPYIESEGQFLLTCHMCGPLMYPMQTDKTGKLIELVVELYHCLAQVPKTIPIIHSDTIADLMYHIKYIYVGHGVLEYVKELMPYYEDELRAKLKFIMPQTSN